MWLTTLPGVLFGTVAVLGPLRMDELGAGAAAIAAAFLAAAALEARRRARSIGRLSDRRGRLMPSMIGVAGGGLVMLAARRGRSSAVGARRADRLRRPG